MVYTIHFWKKMDGSLLFFEHITGTLRSFNIAIEHGHIYGWATHQTYQTTWCSKANCKGLPEGIFPLNPNKSH